MRINSIDYERLELELIEPYTIAYESIDRTTNFILKLHTDDGFTGYGCAAPDIVITHESGDEVEAAINQQIIPALMGQNPFHYARILSELRPKIKSSALSMVDIALFDLMAKKADVPVYELLGGYRDKIATSITIGILPMDKTLRKAQEFIDQGFEIIKLKGGLDVHEDIEKVKRIRQKYPHLILRFDGNQGYDKKTALYFIRESEKYRIEILEQPTSVQKESLMGVLSEQTSMPIMADESLKTLADAFRLTSNGYTDMINIKIMKVGGLLQAQHINSVAKSANNEVMVGCLDECGLGIAAGLHFALSRPNIEFADLDGHLDLIDDPFHDLFILEKGYLIPNGKVGIGR